MTSLASAPEQTTITTPAAPARAASRGPRLAGLKHGLLRAIELSALGFLEPAVRLCWGEEPRKQLDRLGRSVLVPVAVFVGFLLLWSWLAPLHRTKSGAVPTPSVVLSAAGGIASLHDREVAKQQAFDLAGPERERALASVQERLAALAAARPGADAAVAKAETARRERLDAALPAMQEAYRQRRLAASEAQKAREADLRTRAAHLDASTLASALLELERQTDQERIALRQAKDAMEALSSLPEPAVEQARSALSDLADEEQHLKKLEELLTVGNRSLRLTEATAHRDRLAAELGSADDRYRAGLALAQAERAITALHETSAPVVFTLPRQIWRSITCVFAGFLIGTMIAVPIGICCGLSPTFMAAMTPFIALFKPVSPIVWLLIVWIIVVGFIPDADSHWLTSSLGHAPLIGWMKINPAFIASAITVALCSLWATMVNTALGVASVDKDHINVARVLRLGFWARLRTIILPSALPLIFAGMRISLGVGWMVLIAAELLSNSEGIGKYVWDQFNNGASDSFAKIMVCVFVVGLIGLILDRIMIVFQRLVSFEGSVASI